MVIKTHIFYLRLLVDNGVEMVEYDSQSLKEISRMKEPHSFEISQVCICEDHYGIYNAQTPQEFKARVILGYMKDTGQWVFKHASNWSFTLFEFKGYNLSLWSFYKGKNGELLLWNQWTDRDKCYYEMRIQDGQLAVGKKRNVHNSEFEHL